jgi:hypothetical protein
MRFAKHITPLLLLVFIISCTDKKKQTEGVKTKHDNHVYYLSIGNAHYKKDQSTESFGNVQGANTSADIVAENLSAYGSGIKLKSTKAQPLSKEIINTYLDSIINTSVKDSMSVTFIYYCGHGFSDKNGNIFMVPGEHKFNEKNTPSMESLVSIFDIQKRISDAIVKQYPNKKLNKKEGSKIAAMMTESMKDPSLAGNGDKMMKEINERAREMISKFHVPRFIIMADCCTDRFNVVNYELMENLNSKLSSEMNAARQDFKNKFKGPNSIGQEALRNLNKNFDMIGSTMPMVILKAEMFMGGNRAVYTGALGKPAEMVPAPNKPEQMVGPICRRMDMFFDKNTKDFQVAGMLSSLYNKDFDAVSKPATFEMPDAHWSNSSPFEGIVSKYKPSLGDNPYLDKRDSIIYVANR